MDSGISSWFSRTKYLGFTLVELLVTLAVLAILLIIAAPSFQSILLNSRQNVAVDGLVNALVFARNNALILNSTILVCPFSALGSASCGSNWTLGWIVVSQPATGASVILQTFQGRALGPTISSTATSLSFSGKGIATSLVNFKICDSRGAAFGRSVQVLTSGYVQLGHTPGQAVWDGGALTCP